MILELTRGFSLSQKQTHLKSYFRINVASMKKTHTHTHARIEKKGARKNYTKYMYIVHTRTHTANEFDF